MTELTVTCTPVGDGWSCRVSVDDGGSRTEHDVALSDDDLRRFGGGTNDPQRLVEASFGFLLEREPKEAILRSFELPVINRYFPEYEVEIQRRMDSRS
jgi:hypothetical protein